MKTLIKKTIMIMLFAIALTACSKKNDNQPTTASSFTLAGANYPTSTIVFTNNTLLGVAKSNSQVTIGVLFKSRPVAGSYPVVANVMEQAGCGIQATGTGNNSYISIGGGNVQIAITNGKIHATFSGVMLVNIADQSAATVSGDLTEQ